MRKHHIVQANPGQQQCGVFLLYKYVWVRIITRHNSTAAYHRSPS